MHRLLKRQLKRIFGKEAALSDELKALVAVVDDAYQQYDEDRVMLERSLDLSSEELLRSNSELHALFSSLPDLFIRVSGNGKIIGVPGGVAQDCNIREDAVHHGRLEQLLVPQAFAAIAAPLEALVGDAGERQRTVRYHIGAEPAPAHFEARLLRLPQSEVMIVIRDTTDTVLQARAEGQRREQAARLKAMEEFAYVASHDLRAPMRSIQNLAEWISEDLEGKMGSDTEDHLRLLKLRVQRMDDLLVDLLDYCRVGSESVSVDEVNVEALVRGVIDMLDKPDFSFEVGDLPQLHTARGPLQRVFLNLITNAVKHHHTGQGRIAVGCETAEAWVTFWVEDDGPGIPEAARADVFRMFQKLKRRDEVEGSGMGLALIQRIVQEAGGTIEVGDGIDTGTRFTFTWPVAWQNGRGADAASLSP